MSKLLREDLFSLEEYASKRTEFRKQVMAHKKHRKVHLGDHITLYFEDRMTMQYQIQEMLRAERIFEADGIQEELDTYNPLVPDGSNWKATMMLEYSDEEERKQALEKLIGIERLTWVQVGKQEKVYAIADEDLERETEEKTSAVHFLRFELTAEMLAALNAGADMRMGVEHSDYQAEITVPATTRSSLLVDLQSA